MQKNVKIIIAYIKGNQLIKYAISSKIIFKVLNKIKHHKIYDERIMKKININWIKKMQTITPEIKNKYLNHYFNFLGTDWKFWGDSINWKKDILSDYTFAEDQYSSTLIDNLPVGVDIKIPWELGRMQFWPQLAIYAANNEEDAEKIIIQFQQQMEDFMEKNLLGKGVHFYCAMEIAIRTMNLLVTYDILYQLKPDLFDSKFVKKFEETFQRYFYEIIRKLEKNVFNDHAGNHYLSDLTGLLWICMYFKSIQKEWGHCIVEEYKKEIKRQFVEDGANFECSSGYHILSTELILLGLIAINNFDYHVNIKNEQEILKSALAVADIFFTRHNDLVLIGDYDSGRILKLLPKYQEKNIENCLQLVDIYELVQNSNVDEGASYMCLINAYNSKKLLENPIKFRDNRTSIRKIIPFDYNNTEYRKKYDIYVSAMFEKIQIIFLREFGIAKIVSDDVEVYIRCVPEYKKMDISHAHDDVFSYQIFDGDRIIGVDLGSIAYTAHRDIRYFFASNKSHNVPIHAKKILERNGVFDAKTDAVGECFYQDNELLVVAKWGNIWHVRKFKFVNNRIIIEDFSNENFTINLIDDQYKTYGYGQLYRRYNNEHIRKI